VTGTARGSGPPRILYLITDPISTRLLRGQLAALRTAGFEVELGCSAGPELCETARREGVAVHELPFVREVAPMADVRALVATVRLMRRRRPDILNASTPKAGLLGMLAAWLGRVKVRVYVLRGLRFETATGAQRMLLKTLERLATSCSTVVVCNSSSLRRAAEAERVLARGKGVVLGVGSGNGIDVNRFVDLPTKSDVRRGLGLNVDAFVIGFVGRLTADKGFADLVAAYQRARVHEPALRLLVVGDYEAGDPVAPATRAIVEADPTIVRAGWVADPAGLYPAVDVLAFPSLREGLPNAPLEAQAVGVPVVAYAATGTVDSVRQGETGVLVPVGDVDALAAAIVSLAGDPQRAAAMGAAGQAWVAEAFDQQRLWARLAAVYRDGLAA